MNDKRLWRITKTVLKTAVTVLALYWVFQKVEVGELKAALVNSNPLFLVLAFFAYCGSIVIAASRLNGFFRGLGLHLSARFNLRLYLLGLFYNLFLPGGVGGDGYKIYFLRKKFGVKGKKLLSAVFFDRLSGFWALCLIVSALIIFIPKFMIPREIPVLVVILGTLAYYFVIRRYFPAYSKQFVMAHIKAIGVQSMQVVCAIFLLYALGFEGKFSPYLFMFLLSSLVAVIPITPGGIGIRELANVYGAAYFDLAINAELAVLLNMLFYITTALLASSGAYYILRTSRLGEEKLPTIKDAEDAMEKDRQKV